MSIEGLKSNKFIKRIMLLFTQGLSAKALALSLSMGIFIGVIPIWGVTNFILPIIAIRFRLNIAIMGAVTYLAIPLQLFLWKDFIRLGEYVIGTEHTLLSVDAIREAFQKSFFQALHDLWMEVLCGLSGWIILGSPVTLLLFALFWILFRLVIKEKKYS